MCFPKKTVKHFRLSWLSRGDFWWGSGARERQPSPCVHRLDACPCHFPSQWMGGTTIQLYSHFLWQVLEGNCFVFSMHRRFCTSLFPNRLDLKEYYYNIEIQLLPDLCCLFSAILVGSRKGLLTHGCWDASSQVQDVAKWSTWHIVRHWSLSPLKVQKNRIKKTIYIYIYIYI